MIVPSKSADDLQDAPEGIGDDFVRASLVAMGLGIVHTNVTVAGEGGWKRSVSDEDSQPVTILLRTPSEDSNGVENRV